MSDLPEHLRSIYRTSERHENRRGFVCLDRNERATPIPDSTFRDMLARLSVNDVMSYPDAGPFTERVARQLRMPEDYIAETAGSDGALRRLFMAYLRPGGVVVTLDPSYAMYELYTRIFQGVSRRVPYSVDRRCDVDALLSAITPGVSIVIVAHPDQPMGTAIAVSDIHRIIARAGKVGAACLVDEAYYPFHPVTVVDSVREFDNLIVTRSFSKSPGCAGIRLGYAIAQPQIIQGMMAVRGGNEVSGLALAIGSYVLDHPEIALGFRTAVEQGRAMLVDAANRIGFESLPCVTNFHHLRCPPDVESVALAAALERKRYLVKAGFSHPALINCIRVSLNGPDVMRPFVEILAEATAEVCAA